MVSGERRKWAITWGVARRGAGDHVLGGRGPTDDVPGTRGGREGDTRGDNGGQSWCSLVLTFSGGVTMPAIVAKGRTFCVSASVCKHRALAGGGLIATLWPPARARPPPPPPTGPLNEARRGYMYALSLKEVLVENY